MNHDEMSRKELIAAIEERDKRIAALKEANSDLVAQLQQKDHDILRTQRELEERMAQNIRRENDTRLSIDRYTTLVANIPGAVYRCANDVYWTMEYISEQIEEFTGYPASDFINNAVRSYNSIIHPDDVLKVVDAVNEGVKNHRSYTIEYRVKHRNGSDVWVYERGAGVYDEGGHLLWLDGIIFDFTHNRHHRK